MFEWLFKRKDSIQRQLHAPLLEERLRYLQYWYDNGATFKTLRRYSNYLIVIVKVLQLETHDLITFSDITKATKKLDSLSNHHHNQHKSGLSKNSRNLKTIAIQWLDMLGRLQYPDKKESVSSKLIDEYVAYMRYEKGLSEESIYLYERILTDFFKNIGENYSLSRLNILKIDKILNDKHRINEYGRWSIRSYASAIRLFLTYAEGRRLCQVGLAKSIKTPRMYKDEGLPRGPSWEDVQKLLESVEGDDPICVRDRAILMLLAIYGFRCGEVIKLRLDDLDWENEILHVNRSKNAKPQQFPLLYTVGNAIIRYLKEVRPSNCSHREIFISLNAPYRPLSTAAVFQIVSPRLKVINTSLKHYGPHSLRHACATYLINQGITLKEISNQLGHRNLDSTSIYAKVDLVNLRKVTDDLEIGDLI